LLKIIWSGSAIFSGAIFKGSNFIPPLRNTINDEHLDEMVYDDDKKCELLNKYFSLVSKLEEGWNTLPCYVQK
jgi:hypothetical protein